MEDRTLNNGDPSIAVRSLPPTTTNHARETNLSHDIPRHDRTSLKPSP